MRKEREIRTQRCKATAHHSNKQCKYPVVPGKDVCRFHGGLAGRPIVHALYSQCVPDDWKDAYNHYKTDPEYLSMRTEIALAQTNMDRFLNLCNGMPFTTEMRDHLMSHLELTGKLKEKENKRVFQTSVIQEILSKQVRTEAAILKRVLSQYVDATTAERAAAEFADLVGEAASTGTSVSVG